jgi:zinc finger HIT domain-containing protein 1
MNNFGVIEIASTTTKNTPGWAYVPDTGPALPAALQPTNRKRAARNQPALSLSDLSAREETRIRKDLEALDRDNHRDVHIPIPPRPGGSRGVYVGHSTTRTPV